MEWLDTAIAGMCSRFQGRWPLFDHIVLDLFQMDTFKLMPMVTVIVALWLSAAENSTRQKALFDGVVAGFIALVASRVIQNVGPFRARPALSGEFIFAVPDEGFPNDWSSFPSDTASLGFALAFTIWRTSRPLGMAAFLWAVVVVSFPRLYGGYHYLSDMVAGAAIGIGCAWAYPRSGRFAGAVWTAAGRIKAWRPVCFYAALFIVAFQLSTYFYDIRRAGQKSLESVGIIRTADR
jgi:undecaprenyl-diphosphatase